MLSAFLSGGVPRLSPAAGTSLAAQHGAQRSRRPRTPTILCAATPSVSPACIAARDTLLSSIRGTGRGVESPADTTAAVMQGIDALVDACAGQEDDDCGDWVNRLAGRWRLLFSTEAGLTALMGGGVPLVSAADVYQLVENGGALKVPWSRSPEDVCRSTLMGLATGVRGAHPCWTLCRASDTHAKGLPMGIRQPLTLPTFGPFSARLSWPPWFFLIVFLTFPHTSFFLPPFLYQNVVEFSRKGSPPSAAVADSAPVRTTGSPPSSPAGSLIVSVEAVPNAAAAPIRRMDFVFRRTSVRWGATGGVDLPFAVGRGYFDVLHLDAALRVDRDANGWVNVYAYDGPVSRCTVGV